MTWARTDDDFPEHVKIDLLERLSGSWQAYAAARTVWHDLLCDCARRRTDGAFDRARAHRVVRLPPEVVDKAIGHLVAVRLFEEVGTDAWVFHDWTDYQPTKAELDEDRKANARRQAEWRKRQRAVRAAKDRNAVSNAVTDTVTNAVTDGVTDGVSHAQRSTETVPDQLRNAPPSRPIPSPSVSPTGDTPPTPSPGVRAGEGGAPRLGTVERQGFRADELAALLRERAKGRVLAAGVDARVLVQLQRAMDDAARGGATRAAYEVLADWYAAGSQSWRTTRPLGLAELATKPGELAEHLELAAAWSAAGRPAITHTRVGPARTRRVGPAPAEGVDLSQYADALGGK